VIDQPSKGDRLTLDQNVNFGCFEG
jgi:hypothetical protein